MSEGKAVAYGSAVGLPSLAYAIHPHGSFIFPPLGSLSVFVFPVVLAIVHLTRRFSWGIFARKGIILVVGSTFALTLSSLFAYFEAALTYIVPVPYLADHRIIYVSVGTEITAFAKRQYPDKTRTEMLSKRGVDDGAVYKLWESESINLGRIELFGFYTLLVISFASLSGAITRLQEFENRNSRNGRVLEDGPPSPRSLR